MSRCLCCDAALHREIADMYGVSRGAISKIARGESWKGVGS